MIYNDRLNILLILLSLSFCLAAQDTEVKSNGYIGLGIGSAIPIASTSSNDLYNSQAGFAKQGLEFTLLDFRYSFSGKFGFQAVWLGAAMPVDEGEMAISISSFRDEPVDVSSDPWALGAIMAGPMYSIHYKGFELDLMVRMGTSVSIYPEQNITRASDGNFVAEFLEQEQRALAWGLAISARVPISKKISGSINIGYVNSRPEFIISRVRYRYSIQYINTSIGLGFRLK